MERVMNMKNRVNPYLNIGICEGEDIENKLYHTACAEVDSFEGLEEDMIKEIMPASKYIMFTHKGRNKDIVDTYKYIYKEWLPYSGYELSKTGRDMQIYDYRKFGGNPENQEMDIYLPIE